MLEIPQNLTLSTERYKVSFEAVWNYVSDDVKVPMFRHYTDHTIDHSTRVILLASDLIKMGKIELSQEERFVLLCAIALHDIGMHTNEYIDGKPENPTDIQLKIIRENHHKYSFELITKYYKEYGLQRQDGLIKYIAQVAKNHRETDLENESDIEYASKPLRLKLLSVIIRISDCLDRDFQRVNIDKLLTFNISAESKFHWFCHYYVQSLKIAEKKVKLVFRFPPKYKGTNIEASFVESVTSEIEGQISELSNLLLDYDISFYKNSVKINDTEYLCTLKELPEDVINYINKNTKTTSTQQEILSGRITPYVEKILKALDKPLFDISNGTTIYKRATTDNDVKKTLQVRIENNKLTSDVLDFLSDHNEAEKEFYSEAKDAVWGHIYLNPREKNRYKDYFYSDAGHIKKFDKLLEDNKNCPEEKVKIFDKKVTVLLGKTGAGKTITQNVWLYNNNNKLEEKNVFWVRLDVEKLYKLWTANKEHINTEEYFLGQLAYVFCKRFRKLKDTKTHIDSFANEEARYTNSTLITKIYERLNSSSENNLNILNIDENLTKKQLNYEDEENFFKQKLKTKGYSRITEYLSYLDEQIATYEHTYRDEKERLAFAPNRRLSYLIDKVFEEKPTTQSRMWKCLGKILKAFILEEKYCILYMVDGIDNISFEGGNGLDYYRKLLNQLLEFPLHQNKVGHTNEAIFMFMRNSTFEDLKKIYREHEYASDLVYHDWQKFKKISIDVQKDNNVAKEILERRVKYIINKSDYSEKSRIAKVLSVIEQNHTGLLDEEKWWDSNYRFFLKNHIMLARYIAFRSYWGNIKEENFNKNYIEREIENFEDINFYLNGGIYAHDDHNEGSGDGTTCFNIFGYYNKEVLPLKPLYFIYTYILLIIDSLGGDTLGNNIVTLMDCLGFYKYDTEYCIGRLVRNGMLEKRIEGDDFAYDVTKKGKFIFEKFYSNVEYLYYSCLDTKLPEVVFESIKKYISPNNVQYGENRNFPPNCIITGISFLNYLKFEHELILNDKRIKQRLLTKGFDIKLLKLPINDDSNKELLRCSINKMIKIFIKDDDTKPRDENYRKRLGEWLKAIEQISHIEKHKRTKRKQ